MAGDEVVVHNAVSRYGLHQLHVISPKPIETDRWIAEEVESGEVELVVQYEEKAMHLHHMRMYWREIKDGQPVRGDVSSLLEKYANENGGTANGSK